ncbi:uncharacterized protein EV154DRAFT_486625 [Mucor mucedo]|uniref:uncharacterized protein n=1 Tax=Mucor mucedo TaxID=29922 RepID=UPI0022206D87|nr:uncharacterized protein EV154DRAFT_486625 [Mucor mucedo]KAI7875835.1 hypothetical protein EV154DRAFT_486625 [Mucor mucedo]
MRYLRNVLVNFAGAKTKLKKGRFNPVIEEKRVSLVFVNYATLYTLFYKDYNIFNSEGDRFTSVHDIKDTQGKQFVFKNFFDRCTVDRIMKEQKMTFGFSLYYSNRKIMLLWGNSFEYNRMNLGRSFRAKEKSNHPWDTKLMFALNKARHRQSLPISTKSLQIPDKMKADLKNNRLLIQEVDPGIVTTAAISCVKSSTLFESLNRFQMLKNHEPCTIPISNQKEKKKKYDIEKNRFTRKIRLNTYHKKHYSVTRRDIFSYHGWKRGSILSFVGNWSGKGAYIRGHTRRSMKPILNRLNSVADDYIAVIDEFKSTITCSSCFEVTTKQVVRVGVL